MKEQVIICIGAVIISFFSISCRKADDRFSVSGYFDQQTQDSLLVNIVTYIGKKPRLADYQTRHNTDHRNFYIQQAKQFRFQYYHVSDDSVHYYYLIRPARSTRGNLRGAGGKFKTRDHIEIYDLVELFITPVLGEEELFAKGEVLFMEMIRSGNPDKYISDKNYIEWPDERLRYDRTRNEWRYDVNDE